MGEGAKGDKVSISLNDDHIIVKSGRTRAKIEKFASPSLFDIDFPSKSIFVDGNLISAFTATTHAVDINNPKYEINGALLQAKENKCTLVATDTRRLAVCSFEDEISDVEIIIPRAAILTTQKIFGDGAELYIGDNEITLTNKMDTYSTKLISGQFPNWSSIVPSYSKSMTFNKSLLMELVKDASVLESDIAVTIVDGTITIRDESKQVEVTESIDSDTKFRFAIDANFVIDALNSIDSDTVEISYESSELPLVFKSGNYMEIIMPIVGYNFEDNSSFESELAA